MSLALPRRPRASHEPTPLVILHGWSDRSANFTALRNYVASLDLGMPVVINLADYVSMDDAVRFDAMLVRSLQPPPDEGAGAEPDPVRKREGHIVTLAVLEKLGLPLEPASRSRRDARAQAGPDLSADQVQHMAELADTPDLAERINHATGAYVNDPALAAFRKYKESIKV